MSLCLPREEAARARLARELLGGIRLGPHVSRPPEMAKLPPRLARVVPQAARATFHSPRVCRDRARRNAVEIIGMIRGEL